MANCGYIVPTRNLDNFNRDYLRKLVSEYDPNLSMVERVGDSALAIYQKEGKNSELVVTYWFGSSLGWMANFDDAIRELENNYQKGTENYQTKNTEYWKNLSISLSWLKNFKPDVDNVLEYTRGDYPFNPIKGDLDFVIRDYYRGYIFDEGIHPEFMGPEYARKPKKEGLIKKFGKFLPK